VYKPESLRCKACCVVGDTSELVAQLQGTAAAAASMVEGGDSDSALYDVMNELQDTQQQSTNVRLPWGLVAQFVTTVFCSILLPVVGPIQGPSTDDGGSGRCYEPTSEAASVDGYSDAVVSPVRRLARRAAAPLIRGAEALAKFPVFDVSADQPSPTVASEAFDWGRAPSRVPPKPMPVEDDSDAGTTAAADAAGEPACKLSGGMHSGDASAGTEVDVGMEGDVSNTLLMDKVLLDAGEHEGGVGETDPATAVCDAAAVDACASRRQRVKYPGLKGWCKCKGQAHLKTSEQIMQKRARMSTLLSRARYWALLFTLVVGVQPVAADLCCGEGGVSHGLVTRWSARCSPSTLL
jgi:hypothetical protein